ncbi:metal ABC transporter solute-binding protein, Zn/Mn family [Iningainema tapete]|uniref:Zinc ABC transporter substrate-binding protein n=1 Tax=Iningainema tapete BLCC-T55 TaxID=2748662 RepID=A0A8J7BYD5_9CYAN|nr:zinc ABC transporter substrate-binding protein [Iningainema tapete]MBD2773958.1 zinc ABC transporter substrate-binding protein [Iningainema tapete BLCC-T55]
MSKKLLNAKSFQAGFLALTISLFGCKNLSNVANTSTTVTSAQINNNLPIVVVTTSVLCDLTRQVAGETINLTCLIPPDRNPYLYQPKPEDSAAIEQAKLILYSGYNLEPRVFKLIKASKNNVPKIAVGQRAVPKPIPLNDYGNIPADPYVWHNAKNGIRMVEVINTNLGRLLPKNASLYNSNAQKLKNELTQLDTWIKSRIASIPADERQLVTTRDTMSYYVQAYGLSYASALKGISSGGASAAGVKTLVQGIQKTSVPKIFTETTANPNLVKAIAQQARVKVSERRLFADDLGASGSEGDTYQKMMVANTRTIVEGLGGTYLIFRPKVTK